jgi:CubicO group peptidase (beta-lactamase class C family)
VKLHKRLKLLFQLVGLTCGLVFALILGVVASLWLRDGYLFVWRLATYPFAQEVMRVDWYSPTETVAGSPRPAEPELRPAPPALQTALQEAQRYWEARRTSAFLVWHDGQLVHEWYYPGLDAQIASNSMSMAKPMLALAIGKAIESGKIPSVEATVENWITEWKGDPRGKIRLIDLLQMRSGLTVNENSLNPYSDIVRLHMRSKALPVLLDIALGAPPGTRAQYLNWNSELLVLALQRAVGMPYSRWLGEKVWSHLGTQSAKVWVDDDNGLAKAYCCLIARPRDWLQVGLMFLNQGRVNGKQVVAREWIEQMITPSPLRSNYGYGMWLSKVAPTDYVARRMNEPFAASDLFYLDGRGLQRVYVIPSRKLVIVRIGEAWPGFIEETIPNLLIRAVDSSRAKSENADREQTQSAFRNE